MVKPEEVEDIERKATIQLCTILKEDFSEMLWSIKNYFEENHSLFIVNFYLGEYQSQYLLNTPHITFFIFS